VKNPSELDVFGLTPNGIQCLLYRLALPALVGHIVLLHPFYHDGALTGSWLYYLDSKYESPHILMKTNIVHSSVSFVIQCFLSHFT